MKKSPQLEKLESLLRSSKLSACGFIGKDRRGLWEIIDADAATLEKLKTTKEEVAARMQQLTDLGVQALGDRVKINENLEVKVDDHRGLIPCPWPHHVRCFKRNTTAVRRVTNKRIYWSDLNIHMIKEHGFFEGIDSPFRIDPQLLVEIIFS